MTVTHKCTKSLGINGNHARLESENKTSRTKGTHDSRTPDDMLVCLHSYVLAASSTRLTFQCALMLLTSDNIPTRPLCTEYR